MGWRTILRSPLVRIVTMKPNARRAFRLAYAAWLLGLFAFFMPGATWNPVSRFDLTRAIVERQTLSIDAYASSTGDRSLVDGQWFTDKAPLPSLLAVPAYALIRLVQASRGENVAYDAYSTATTPAVRLQPNRAFRQALYVCSLSTAAASGVAIGLLLFELVRRRATSSTALAASAIGVLGTPIWPYSTSFYGHVPAAAALLGALVSLDSRGQRFPDGRLPRWRVRLGGLCLAMAPGCEYITAVPAALIGFGFLLTLPREARARAVGDFALGAALPVSLVSAYHTAVFGAPWRTGYSFIARPEFAAGHARGLLGINLPSWEGLWGLTVGTRRGLFYLSPVLALGLLAGAWRTFRTRDHTLRWGLLVFVLLLLMNAGYYMWWGGAAGGPRHLVPAIAMLVVGIGPLVRRLPSWRGYVTLGIALWSVGNCLALTLVGLEAPEDGNILTDYVWPALGSGRIYTANGATNVGVKLGLSPALSPLPLLIWVVLGYLYLARQVARDGERLRVREGATPRPERLGVS